MDDTKATPSTSSSSAAVADSAGAAASSAGTDVGTKANASATSVKLLIKASNQQYADQVVESDLLWTVKHLKQQLSQCYPSKPPVADQKLIYSGQLLTDSLQLKDVIRSYKDVYTQNHIFHLVYTPKNIPAPKLAKIAKPNSMATANSPNTDGLRHRTAAAEADGAAATGTARHGQATMSWTHSQQQLQQSQSEASQQQLPSQYMPHAQFMPQMMAAAAQAPGNQQAAQVAHAHAAYCPQFDPNNPQHATMPFSLPGQFSMQAMATQQAAVYNWMQQVYSQYMDQCLRLSSANAGIANVATPDTVGVGAGAAAGAANPGALPYPYLSQMPFMVPNNMANGAGNVGLPPNPVIPFPSATATPAANFVAQPHLQAAAVAQAQADAGSDTAVDAADGQIQQPQQQPQQQPDERPLLAAPRFPNIVQEEVDNRDWLDSFFAITRLAIFMTILYFNSSPLRCIIVLFIAGAIYLYHIGVLRWGQERNNNNINRNNNAAVAAAAEQIRQGVQQVQQAQAAQQQQGADQQAEGGEPNAAAALDNEGATDRLTPATGEPNAALPDEELEEGDAAGAAGNTTSVISFVRTFVVTFFTSLLPEAPL